MAASRDAAAEREPELLGDHRRADRQLNYCGEAPGATAGLVQVNALIPSR
jgi:hypothetical protein